MAKTNEKWIVWEKDTENGAVWKIFGPFYFLTALATIERESLNLPSIFFCI